MRQRGVISIETQQSPSGHHDPKTQTILNRPATVVPGGGGGPSTLAGDDVTTMTWSGRPAVTQFSKINYAAWRNENREWFVRQFPWVFKAQDVLASKHGVQADYIELLMVSGDLWQFQYDRRHVMEQSLANYAPASMGRLASHYGVSSKELTDAVTPGTGPTFKDSKATTDSTPALENGAVKSLRNWGTSILAAAESPKGIPMEVQISLLRTGTYLGKTRTAAYLWIRENKNVAATALATQDEATRSMGLDRHASMNVWLERLEVQGQAAEQVTWSGQQLLALPATPGCAVMPAQLQRALAHALETLIPAEPTLSVARELDIKRV